MSHIESLDNLSGSDSGSNIPEDRSRLQVIGSGSNENAVETIIEALRRDQVVLLQNMTADDSDKLMLTVSDALGIKDSLELQAAFASSLGHRENIGTYYMSVNKRTDFQFVAPHSEGSSFTNMQLASFYGYENSTDGGETILMNTSQSSDIWGSLREKARKGKSERELSPGDIRKLKGLARLNMPEDTLQDDDEILSEEIVMPGFTAFDVLAKPKRSYSILLEQELYVYWNSIESIDRDSPSEFNNFLRSHKLLKLPEKNLEVDELDDLADHRIRRFGSNYDQLFKAKITHKLQPGDFIIQNNLTWCHSVNNWTPGSGTRSVSAAFA